MIKQELIDVTDFGSVVRAARRERGMSQRELARVCGCSQRFVSELERGKPTAEIGKALGVAQALGLRIEAATRDPGAQGRRTVERLVDDLNGRLAAGSPRKSLCDYVGGES